MEESLAPPMLREQVMLFVHNDDMEERKRELYK